MPAPRGPAETQEVAAASMDSMRPGWTSGYLVFRHDGPLFAQPSIPLLRPGDALGG
jgi:hypothetical protein